METVSTFYTQTEDYFNLIELDQEQKYQQYLDPEEDYKKTDKKTDKNNLLTIKN